MEAIPEGALRSFIRTMMVQGAAIHYDYLTGVHKSYENYSARLDEAAKERTEQFIKKFLDIK